MSDNMLRHVISFLGMLAFIITYWAGYMTGTRGWWIVGIFTLLTYAAIYKLIEV